MLSEIEQSFAAHFASTTGVLLYRNSTAYTEVIMNENREAGVLLERLRIESK